MSTKVEIQPNSERELVLCRILDAPCEKLYQAWTEPELVKQWFTPKPWITSGAELDVRAGGASLITMRSPDGKEYPNPGVFLEVIPNRKIVATDAFTKAWEPSAKPFMTSVITFEDLGNGKTKYTARALHWSIEDRIQHEKMGFHEGWGLATDQLEALAASL